MKITLTERKEKAAKTPSVLDYLSTSLLLLNYIGRGKQGASWSAPTVPLPQPPGEPRNFWEFRQRLEKSKKGWLCVLAPLGTVEQDGLPWGILSDLSIVKPQAISQGQASFQDLLSFLLAELHDSIYFPLSKAATIYSLSWGNPLECSHLWDGVVYLHLSSCWRPISVLRLTVVWERGRWRTLENCEL